eukprot:4358696-Prymnesium_polylepis.1
MTPRRLLKLTNHLCEKRHLLLQACDLLRIRGQSCRRLLGAEVKRQRNRTHQNQQREGAEGGQPHRATQRGGRITAGRIRIV